MGLKNEIVTSLSHLVEQHHAWGVKAEFESEGTQFLELIELVSIAKQVGANIAVKIGGPEAVRDLLELRAVGVDTVVAPMCESGYAVRKFSEAILKVFGGEDSRPDFFVNFETAATWGNRESFITELEARENISGVVFGRVDFSLSSGFSRDDINSDVVLEAAVLIAQKCRALGKKFVVGGGVSAESVRFLERVAEQRLDRYETRKVVFDSGALNSNRAEDGILAAVRWEVAWLEYKKTSYERFANMDAARIEMLRARWG